MDKITVEFEGYRQYNPFEGNIFVVDEDKNDVIFLKRRRLPKSTIYKNMEDFINNKSNGKPTKTDGQPNR